MIKYNDFSKFYSIISQTYYDVYYEVYFGKELESLEYKELVKIKHDFHDKFVSKLLEKTCKAKNEIKTTTKLDNNKKIIFRGVSPINSNEYLKLLKAKEYTFHRYGYFGYGSYFSPDKSFALEYSNFDERKLIQANLEDNANFVQYSDIYAIFQNFVRNLLHTTSKVDREVAKFLYENKDDEVFLSALASIIDKDVIFATSQNYCIVNPEKVTFLTQD